MHAWKDGTKKQCECYLKKLRDFVERKDIDIYSPTVQDILEFLTILHNKGLGYSALNTARSSLSSIVSIEGRPAGEHILVTKFMKGAFNLRPVNPKTNGTWDPEIMLKYLKTLSPVKKLSFKMLTYKAVTLLWLLSGQRGQGIKLIDIRNVDITKNGVKVRYGDILKTTRLGFQQKEINIKAYAPDRRLCVSTVLEEYVMRRNKLCGSRTTQLFITTQKPHGPATSDSIARWVKEVMREAGLDISKFTPHSIRAASTSAAARGGVPISSILSTAGWSRESTFRKYYNKPLVSEDYNVQNVLN